MTNEYNEVFNRWPAEQKQWRESLQLNKTRNGRSLTDEEVSQRRYQLSQKAERMEKLKQAILKKEPLH